MTLIIHWNGWKVKQAETIRLPRNTDTSAVIVLMNSSFMSVTNVVLSYALAFELQNGDLVAEASIKDIIADMIQLHYLPKQ